MMIIIHKMKVLNHRFKMNKIKVQNHKIKVKIMIAKNHRFNKNKVIYHIYKNEQIKKIKI